MWMSTLLMKRPATHQFFYFIVLNPHRLTHKREINEVEKIMKVKLKKKKVTK